MFPNHKIFILFLFWWKSGLTANILYVVPVASPSHYIWNKAFALGLNKNGHNITMVTQEVDKQIIENYTVITLEGLYDVLHKEVDIEGLVYQNNFKLITVLYDYFAYYTCEYDYKTAGFQTLLNYPDDYKFDLIIYDATLTRCMYPLTERFGNPPALAVTPFLLPPLLNHVFGNHLHTSYMPHYMTIYTKDMSLSERALNFLYTSFEILYRNYWYLPSEDKLAKEKFKNLRHSMDELERRVSLLLCNADPVLGYPEALPPNIIPVGGLHATRPKSSLPKDLQDIMHNSKDGVILFSLGTNVRSDQISSETRQALLKAFSKLPQTVIWKFESDNVDDLPKNVFIKKWLPQNDILAHPNTKLFINHGGALSSQEAMYHGLPVVGIPYFYDQHVNIKKLVEKGVAVGLNKDNLTTENVYEAVTTALKYTTNMKTLSKRYHDKPQTALERAVFWAEYLIRNGNAEHLVSRVRDLPFYQTYNLDVMLLFVFSLILLYSFTRIVVVAVFVRLFYSVNKIKKD